MFQNANRTRERLIVILCACLISLASGSVWAQGDSSHPKIAFLFEGSESVSPALIGKAATYFGDRITVKTFALQSGSAPLPSGAEFSGYDLIVVDVSGDAEKILMPLVKDAETHTKVVILGSQTETGNVTVSKPTWPQQYWSSPSVENLVNLIRLLAADGLHLAGEVAAPPVHYPDQAFYHPGAPGFFDSLSTFLSWYAAPAQESYGYVASRCTIGVLFYFSYYTQQSLSPFDAVLKEIEKRGCNAIGIMSRGAPNLNALRLPNGRPFVDVLLYNGERINLKSFAAGTEEANTLGVPLLGLYLDYKQSREQYLQSQGGLAPGMSGALNDAEQDGIFEPIMIASRHNPHDPVGSDELLPEQIRWRVDRAVAWASLRHKSNAQKRVVFTYWSECGGKADVGGDPDEFLNVPGSLVSLLHAMKGAGYDLGSRDLPEREQLAKLMSQDASNVGTWAPADLARVAKSKHAVLIPEQQYKEWFNALPQSLRNSVIEQWGAPPGNVMVYIAHNGARFLVIPALMYGNILIAPHPDWGYEQTQKALMSTGALPPHHQYLAFFLWLQHQWNADAWVSLFTNITLQPGKSEGPLVSDAEGVLLGNIPHIHPELLGGSGGIASKRKALGLTVGWFRGAVSADTDGLYHKLREQADAIAGDPQHLAQSDAAFRKAVKEADFGHALPLNIATAPVNTLALAVLRYLDELSREAMPHGSHVLGDVPSGETLVQTVIAMLQPDITSSLRQSCDTRCFERLTTSVVLQQTEVTEAVRSITATDSPALVALMHQAVDDATKIHQGGREIDAILEALDGKRLVPGPADDPLLRPEALPAGRSLFSFDTAAIPTRQAETLGVSAADATITAFRNNHGGQFPTKLAFVLWTSELSANGGVTEAEILQLLGVRPVRNARNQVVDVKLIPRSELNRPRVDVLVTTSGLYRDHYKDKIDLIQRAVALAQESPEPDNPIRHDTERARDQLLQSNSSSQDADRLSAARVFAPAPNAYSPSIQFLAKSGDLRGDDSTMAQLFTNRMDHVYGVGADGTSSLPAFRSNLGEMQAATLSRSDQVNALLDNSMPAGFLGGLNMAAKAVNGGHDSDLYIDTIRSGMDPKIEPVSHVIQRELQSKYLNPAWIKGMQASGYDGARYMSEMTDNLSLWNSTAKQSVQSETWETVKRVYVDDQYHLGMSRYFEQRNPYARQVLLATLLDVASRGYWQATGPEKAAIAAELARSAAVHGLVGSADVNRNAGLTKIISESIAGLPGRSELMRGYAKALSASTDSSIPSSSLTHLETKSKAPSQPSAPQAVTGLVLRESPQQAAAMASHESIRTALILISIVITLLVIGWFEAARKVY